jgi:hypothetical protein
MSTMRTLGRRLRELAAGVDAGHALRHGLPVPEDSAARRRRPGSPSAAHAVREVRHPVDRDDDSRALGQVPGVDRAEEPLAGVEVDGYGVRRRVAR